jgi:hypothetical protein
MTGLELIDNKAIALTVDDAGHVLGRAESGPAADAKSAALDVLKQLPSSTRPELTVAAVDPESAESAAAMKALLAKYRSPWLHDPPVASGIAAAAAEAWVGAARGAKDVVFFAVGDHAVAGIIRDGAPVTGKRHRAPAVAWLALNPVEREDYRKVGCLEAEVAGQGIVRRLIWRVKAGDPSSVPDAVKDDFGAITVDHILDAARNGDGVSISVMRDTARYLGMAGANLALVADPDVLVLGGIMASAGDLLFDAVRTEVVRRLPPMLVQSLTIVRATLGADAPAIGAVRLAAAAVP